MAWERNHELTAREREILLWACRGKTYGETATIVGVAIGSVKTYLDHARYKLNAVNVAQACAVAVALGIFAPEDILNRAVPSADPASTPPPPQSPPIERQPR
jgi:DNA-binding CsgD family transcriptional regulator